MISTENIEVPKINGHHHETLRKNLTNAMTYLEQVMDLSLENHLKKKKEKQPYPQFEFLDNGEPLFAFVMECQLSFEEFIILLLALAPHVKPNLLDSVIEKHMDKPSDLPEIGGRKTQDIRYMMPTGDTVLFVLAGYDLEKRIEVQSFFDDQSFLVSQGFITLDDVNQGEPKMSGRLGIDQDLVDLFTKGFVDIPKFSPSFPAQHISTQLEWEDLVLPETVKHQVAEIKNWVLYNDVLLHNWGMEKKMKPGYLALFWGPPGTGKTLTASMLGKYTDRQVFRVDLSSLISKYVGETQKNLASLFDKAEHKKWILVFEEADALFGKRTSINSAQDKYLNQEVAYLLQRVESFSGLVILTTNFKGNMDDAFLRRFGSIIHFPIPNEDQRLDIWKKSFPKEISLFEPKQTLKKIAQAELAGGNIINIVQYVCLKAIEEKRSEVSFDEIEKGIARELEKNGKVYKPSF